MEAIDGAKLFASQVLDPRYATHATCTVHSNRWQINTEKLTSQGLHKGWCSRWKFLVVVKDLQAKSQKQAMSTQALKCRHPRMAPSHSNGIQPMFKPFTYIM